MPFTDDPLWYKDAVIYQLHIKSFFDANNDGVGDFAGLIDRLDYIAQLGVNTIWLLPFYPSPRRDDGYDIAAYIGVHPDYGTMEDARRFIDEAHKRGLRVITELVVNHTSDQHPWFQRARNAPAGSPERDFYVWADTDVGYEGTRIIFLDTEKSNWTWDPVANQYFWHRFYSHQPDLNYDNPEVLKAVLEIMTYWLDLGVDGLRLDAVPYLIEREGTSNENLPETHAILKKIRAHMDTHFPDRMLLAEANMWPESVQQYFGDDDECHMAFHFPLMPRMYMALAQEDRFPITDILRQTPDIPADCQWAIFLRNHDELTLEMVTDRERDYLWNHYASDKRARINLGIRRRLAPLLEHDRRRIELLHSFLLSMPGTPVMYYGDEIGMGDNIHLGDRDGVRTPMQWTSDRNGGFSRANPQSLVLPAIMDPLYGFQAINVEAQNDDPYSLLNWMRRMLQVRSKHRAFGRGSLRLMYPNNRKILAYLREYDAGEGMETILCVANVSHASQAVEIDLSAFAGKVPVEMLGGVAFPPIGQLPYLLTLPPFGFYWFMLATETSMPGWYVPQSTPLPDYQTLVLPNGAADLVRGAARMTLERDTLPQYLQLRRWYAGKQKKLESVQIALATALPVPSGSAPMMLTELVTGSNGDSDRYFLPLGVYADDGGTSGLPQQLALARVRRDRRVGMLTDAFSLDTFAMLILHLIREQAVIETADGQIRCSTTPLIEKIDMPPQAEVRRMSVEQSNSSLTINDTVVVKVIRHLTAGIHPELEIGRVLTARGYANAPTILGDMTRVAADGTPHTLIVLQGFIHSQGDAWRWTLDTLARTAQQSDDTERETPEMSEMADPIIDLLDFAGKLGTRLAELHAVLAQPCDDPAFSPERATEADCAHLAQSVRQQLDRALSVLQDGSSHIDDVDDMTARLVLQKDALYELIDRLAASAVGALRTRIHGDFHLGQVLVSSGDVYLLDFEGEPARTLEERREKNSPWRDVAGLLRSYDYAAYFSANSAPPDLGEVARARRQKILQRYVPESRDAFLSAYRAAAPDVTACDALLDLFTLEKATYEICYEAANRPTWLPVPLRGLTELAARLLHPDRKEG
ncbi:MAG TPA: maltose alpha-D-glucosyltransferase [Oxalicibacterium sp.]|nr:maltose alpha-D-glucosyltransferase [Oxalicibacterium sp.]HWU96990.1 maltose alpha-D-glucosyltransferase [Oxalicibacterium sp.]